VCTNKPHNIALRVLSGLGLSFEGVIGGGVLPARKPDPAPLLAVIAECGGDVARTVLVGDSVADAGAARSAGVAFIAVDFGYHHGPPSILAPDAWLSRFADLAAVLDSVERRFLTGPSGG
jgi:phosphoglycolate phosphatase